MENAAHAQPGHYMAAEIAQSPGVFSNAARADHAAGLAVLELKNIRGFYTIARGSSDAVANILSYEFMRETGLPMTSLPPSVFSLGRGVDMRGAAGIVISQSGASRDLILSAKGVRAAGGTVVAITNQPGSPVESAAQLTLPIHAGVEQAVPATKTVIGSIATGMAMLAGLVPQYGATAQAAANIFDGLAGVSAANTGALRAALLRAQHVYVIGRDAGFGAAQEVALKLKECCALHAEAYSASEVLHGPLQLVTKPLLVLMLDTEDPKTQASMDTAESRFREAGGTVFRLRPSDIVAGTLAPAAAAALLLYLIYPVILSVATALGHDPDRPATLSKVTRTT